MAYIPGISNAKTSIVPSSSSKTSSSQTSSSGGNYSWVPKPTPEQKRAKEILTRPKVGVSGGGGGGGSSGGISQAPPTSNLPEVLQPKPTAPVSQAGTSYVPGIGNVPTVQKQAQQFQEPQKFSVSAGISRVPTRSEEKTAETGYVSALISSGKKIFDVGSIGEKGFGTYFSDIFIPLSSAGRFSEGDLTPVAATTEMQPFVSGSGTTIAPEYLPYGGATTTRGLSTGEIILMERQKSGEFGDSLTKTPKAFAVSESERIQKEYGTKAQAEFDVGAGLLGGIYQKKIDTGELSYDQATKDYTATTGIWGAGIQRKYTDLSQKDYETSMFDFSQKRTGAEKRYKSATSLFDVSKKVKFGVEVGAITLASTTPVGLTIVGAGFAGKGLADIGGGILQKDIKLGAMGVAEVGFGAFGARSVLGPQREILKFGSSKISVPSNMLERELRKDLFKDLAMQKPFLKSTSPPTEFEGYTQLGLTGGRGGLGKFGAEESLAFNLKSFQVGESGVTVAGTGTRRVSYKTMFGETIKLPVEKFGVGTINPAQVVSKPATFLVGKGGITVDEGFTGATGKVFIKPASGDVFTIRRFSSVAQETPEGFKVISGRQTRVKFKKQIDVGKVDYKITEGGEFLPSVEVDLWLKPTTVRGNIESRAFIEKPFVEEQGGMFRQVIQRGRKPGTSTDVFSRLDTSVSSSQIQKLMQQNIPKTISKDVATSYGVGTSGASMLSPVSLPSTTIRPVTSAYAGTGLYERTDMVSGIAPPKFSGGVTLGPQITTFKPRTDFKDYSSVFVTKFEPLKYDTIVRRSTRSGVTTFQPTGFREATGLRSGQIQLQPTAVSLKMEQRLKLKTSQIIPPTTPFKFNFEPIGGRGTPFGGFFFPGLGSFESRVKRKKGKRSYKRRPSVYAAEFNIKSFKPVSGEGTGLFSRPII